MLAREQILSTDISTFRFRAGEFLEHHTEFGAYGIGLMEEALTWKYEHPDAADAELFVLYVGMLIQSLQRQKSLFAPTETAQKIAHWRDIADEAVDRYEAVAEDEEIDWETMSTVDAILALAQMRTRATVAQDTQTEKQCSKLVVKLYKTLTAEELAAIEESGDCQVFFHVANAYTSLRKPKKAMVLYRRVIDCERIETLRAEGAYVASVGFLADQQEFAAGLTLCREFREFLNTHYAEDHKTFCIYYSLFLQLTFARLATLARRSRRLCTVSAEEWLEILDAAEAYQRLQKRYGEQYFQFPSGSFPFLINCVCEYLRLCFLNGYSLGEHEVTLLIAGASRVLASTEDCPEAQSAADCLDGSRLLLGLNEETE